VVIRTTEKGPRHYFDEGAPEIKYPGVTTVVDMLPKPFLRRWEAHMAADLALDSIEYLQRMADRDREGAKRYIAGAATRYTNHRAAVGTSAHDMFERMIRGMQSKRVAPDMVPYQRCFADFLRVVRPELVRAEDIAWSDTHRYAGSFDAWLRLRVVRLADGTWELDPEGHNPLSVWVDVIADWKTSKGVWPSTAIQMAAYAFAEWMISPDGQRTPMPDFDGAVVLHITPEGWTLYPVYHDKLVRAFDYFLHLREVLDWERTDSRQALGKPLSGNDRFMTGTERRG
jgi:hypothetical protein